MNIAINGFGRIGRAVFKAFLENTSASLARAKPKANIVAINDLTDTRTLAHLLKYDSCYGIYQKKVEFSTDSIIVKGKKYKILALC